MIKTNKKVICILYNWYNQLIFIYFIPFYVNVNRFAKAMFYLFFLYEIANLLQKMYFYRLTNKYLSVSF